MNGYGVDLVLVIDKTGSMRDIFEGTKQNALVLRQKIEQKLAEDEACRDQQQIPHKGAGQAACAWTVAKHSNPS